VIPSTAETRLHFTDQTQQAGIHFKHTNGASKEKYLPETMGSGGLFLDYNNDGHLDIYLVNSGTLSGTSQPHRHPNHANVLYRNTGDGTFVDVTAEAGLQHNYGYGMRSRATYYDYAGDADRNDPRMSPLRYPEFAGQPPAAVHTAGFDPLQDEGIAYAEKLKAASVPVVKRHYAGLIHGYFNMGGAVSAAKTAFDDAAADLRAALHPGR